MALTIQATKRVFQLKESGNTTVLPDPSHEMTVNEVMKHYAGLYPHIINSKAEGPHMEKDGSVRYVFNASPGKFG